MRELIRLFGYLFVGTGTVMLFNRTIVLSFGVWYGRPGMEIQLLSYTVSAIGNILAGYVWLRLTEKKD